MTIVEKAAYLKGLAEGLGVEPNSRDGKIWTALTELLSDMAHEIEDLQATDMEHAEALDDIAEELDYLEEITCDLDRPEDYEDMDEDDEELDYDGIVYDVKCPVCGEEITVTEDTLEEGTVNCPVCGELLEFDLSIDDDEEDD